MVPLIPPQRTVKSNSNAAKPFDDLNKYIEGTPEKEQGALFTQVSDLFGDLNTYVANPTDKETKAEKCIAIKTHGILSLATASQEMNAVAKQNTRCTDPAYHFILSWPEHEQPDSESIFDAAIHALKALGLGEHQSILAIHGNTDNMHCHVSVNRVHPETYKTRHIEWAQKTLHMAARQSEIKHGWTHDNGLYIVEVDQATGRKRIVENMDLQEGLRRTDPHAHKDRGQETLLPTWHDPESLDSWLKTKVAKLLKKELPNLQSWQALHGWLSNFDIALTNTGGGMRLSATSPETGEVLDIAASKGLRFLKRAELERQWGPYSSPVEVVCQVPDLSHLSPRQVAQGVAAVLAVAEPPPEHVLLARQKGVEPTAPLPPLPLHEEITTSDRGSDTLNRAARDATQRAERKAQRAAARLALRQRFAHHQNAVRQADAVYFPRLKELQAERSHALSQLRTQSSLEERIVRQMTDLGDRLIPIVVIHNANLGRKLQIEADFQEKTQALRSVRVPTLSWRAWLLQQAGQGDQAALSALRGIVYQAQRDAKRDAVLEESQSEAALESARDRARHYQKLMARLLDAEQKEAAIRSANIHQMRPYEADALLRLYANMVWHVTANGNVEYRDKTAGAHLFTDRGNRVTFDRVLVEDDEIRLALVHAQQKFGVPLTLTGDDPVFTQRMARLADDMGIAIFNPELEAVIERHRLARRTPTPVLTPPVASPPQPKTPSEAVAEVVLGGEVEENTPVVAAPVPVPSPAKEIKAEVSVPVNTLPKTAVQSDAISLVQRADTAAPRPQRREVVRPVEPAEPVTQTDTDIEVGTAEVEALDQPDVSRDLAQPMPTPDARLRAMALAINPDAKFFIPSDDGRGGIYFGKLVGGLGGDEPGIVQFSTRLDAFIVHPGVRMGDYKVGESIEVQYKNGAVTAKSRQGKGRGGQGD